MNATITQGRESAALYRLRNKVEGDVILPDEGEYDAARAAWNLTIDQTPAAIVVADSIADVQAAVEYATVANLKVAVQTTGHGIPRECHGGLLIRLSRLNYVVVDADRRIAHVGGGAMWHDVLEIAGKEGLAGLCGSTPYVGVVGYMLGGGFSIMSRKYGLGIDTIRSMKVVLADGSLVKASSTENVDLFWAIRGGGGAFGILVEIEIDLLPVADVFGGSVMYPIERAEEIYPRYLDWTGDLSGEVTSSISIVKFPPIPHIPAFLHLKSFVVITACVTDADRGEELMAPMRGFGQAAIDTFARLPFERCAEIYQDPVDPVPGSGQGVMFTDLTEDSLTRFLAAVGPQESNAHLKIEIRHLGGAISNPDVADSAVGDRREAKYLLYMIGIPMPPNSREAMEAQQERVFAALEEEVLCPGPLNFVGERNIPGERMKAVFAEDDYQRLVEIKRDRDPRNRFAFASIGFTE